MEKISKIIQEGKILVSDGAWGTFLQQMGLKPGECPEGWNIHRPENVLKVAQSYIEAGSDMIETNSFGGNAFKLSLFGLQDKVYEINKAAAQISRKAAGNNKHVLGSVGPTGKMLMMAMLRMNNFMMPFVNRQRHWKPEALIRLWLKP